MGSSRIFAERPLQPDRPLGDLQDFQHLFERHRQPIRELLGAGLAADLGQHLLRYPHHFVDFLDDVRGDGHFGVYFSKMVRTGSLYRTGEKDAGISNLFSWRTGRTPACGGQPVPGRRDSSRTRARSLRSL